MSKRCDSFISSLEKHAVSELLCFHCCCWYFPVCPHSLQACPGKFPTAQRPKRSKDPKILIKIAQVIWLRSKWQDESFAQPAVSYMAYINSKVKVSLITLFSIRMSKLGVNAVWSRTFVIRLFSIHLCFSLKLHNGQVAADF